MKHETTVVIMIVAALTVAGMASVDVTASTNATSTNTTTAANVTVPITTSTPVNMTALLDRITELETQLAALIEKLNSLVVQPEKLPIPEPTPLKTPTLGEYYIRVLNSTNSTYGHNDMIHFEAKMLPCPWDDAPQSVDGTYNQVDLGYASIVLENGANRGNLGEFLCSVSPGIVSYTYGDYEITGNYTNSHVKLDGIFTVPGYVIQGEYQFKIHDRKYGYEWQTYYSEPFTLE